MDRNELRDLMQQYRDNADLTMRLVSIRAHVEGLLAVASSYLPGTGFFVEVRARRASASDTAAVIGAGTLECVISAAPAGRRRQVFRRATAADAASVLPRQRAHQPPG